MGLAPLISGSVGIANLAGTTTFHCIFDGGQTNVITTETNAQIKYYAAGTLRNLLINVTTNATSASSTLTSRINGAAGAQSATIGAGATGTFEDVTNTDAVAANDLVNAQLAVGTGGTLTSRNVNALFLPSNTGDTLTKHGAHTQETRTGNALTRYYILQGGGSNGGSTAEADSQYRIRTAGTWRRLNVLVTANTRAGNTTYRSRVNTANGNQLVTVTAAVTGLFEDVTNSDTLADADLVDIEYVQAAGGGSLTVQHFTSELISTAGGYHLIASSPVAAVFAAGSTQYSPIAGTLALASATESTVQTKLNIITALTNLFTRVTINAATSNSTVRTRVNTANGNQLATITALTTGIFEDTTNSDILTATDIVDTQIVIGTVGAVSMTIVGVKGLAQALVTTTAASAITTTTASTGGNVIDGGTSVTARGVAYNTTGSPTIASDPFTTDGSGGGSFSSSLTGLTPGTTYFVRAYATNLAGTVYGNEISFTTLVAGGVIIACCCA